MGKLELNDKQINVLEYLLIVGFALFPLLNSFPYRINIFLSWEGAYRLYLGQVPYKDFGLPMGFGYWVIPAIFFKVFGPYLYTLVKAQVFINIISGIAFRSILSAFDVQKGLRLISVLLFIISFSFFNFWPWYNHSVIVFQLIGFAFLLHYLLRDGTTWKHYIYLMLAGFFLFFSFFTKQDGGGLALLIALIITGYHAIIEKKYLDLVLFVASYLLWASIFIVPFLKYDFTYWFNLGQEPHNSRIELWDFVSTFFGDSMWEKFYLCGFLFLLLLKGKNLVNFFFEKREFIFFLFSLGILVEALLFQVTSYIPPDNNIFFHSFMFAYFMSILPISLSLRKIPILFATGVLVMLWWSGAYWKYIDRKIQRMFPQLSVVEEGKVSKNTYALANDGGNVGMEKWEFIEGLKSFEGIYMPESTVSGIKRLLQMDLVKKEDARILNMSELTPLAYEIG